MNWRASASTRAEKEYLSGLRKDFYKQRQLILAWRLSGNNIQHRRFPTNRHNSNDMALNTWFV